MGRWHSPPHRGCLLDLAFYCHFAPFPLTNHQHLQPASCSSCSLIAIFFLQAMYTVPALVDWFLQKIVYVFFASLVLSATALVCLLLARFLESQALEPLPSPDEGAKAKVEGGEDATKKENPLKAAEEGKTKEDGASSSDGTAADKPEAAEKHGHAHDNSHPDDYSPELLAQLEAALAWAKPVWPLYVTLQFLGIGHLFLLGWRFYCVLTAIICYSSAFYTFLAFGVDWLMVAKGFDNNAGGQTAGIISIFSMVLSPLAGLLMDFRGYQKVVCFGAMLSSCAWFGIMGFTSAPPAMCIVFAGLSYSLLPASLYPLLPEYVPDESFTTVYAILNSAINLAFTLILVIVGQLLGNGDVATLAATRRPSGRHGPILTGEEWAAIIGGGGEGGQWGWGNSTASGGSGGFPTFDDDDVNRGHNYHGGSDLIPSLIVSAAENASAASSAVYASVGRLLEATPTAGPGGPTHHGDPETMFHPVFGIFLTLTFIGVVATGSIAIDGWRKGTNGPLRRAAHH